MDSLNTASPAAGHGPLFYVGSAGLLAVMLIETAAVIGRHVGIPLLGALEMVQAALVPAACAAMLITSLRGAHAAVRLVTDRLPPGTRQGVDAAGSLLAASYFIALSVGSIWLAAEYWDYYEQSEVLHIPFRPLRALIALAAIAIAVAFLRRTMRRPAP